MQRTQRRRGDTAGALAASQMMPHRIEMPEASYEDAEFLCDALDFMNPWFEPGGFLDWGDDFHATDADAYFQLEL